MKSLLLLPLLLLLFGCEKVLPSPEFTHPNHVEIHVEVIDALVVLDVDGQEVIIDGRGAHMVKVLIFAYAWRIGVVDVYAKKATMAIHISVGGGLYEGGAY